MAAQSALRELTDQILEIKSKSHSRDILAATNNGVTMSVIDGSLPKVALGNFQHVPEDRRGARTLVSYYNDEVRLSSPSDLRQPVVVAQFLVDARGEAPTQSEVAEILQYVDTYRNVDHLSSAAVAQRVDTAVSAQRALAWGSGKRHYLKDDAAFDAIKQFVADARSRLPATPGDQRQPRAFAKYGVTNNARRLYEVDYEHRGYTFVMYLVEAVCVAYFPQYRIRSFVIYKVWDIEQTWVADRWFNRIGHGNMSSGFGMLHRPCDMGVSAEAADILRDQPWEKFTDEAVMSTPLIANLKEQKVKNEETGDIQRAEEIGERIKHFEERRERVVAGVHNNPAE